MIRAADSRLHRTLAQLRRLREALEQGSFGTAGKRLCVIPDEYRRAEDRIRNELQDTRAITVRARKKRYVVSTREVAERQILLK